MASIDEIREQILEVQPILHGAGTVSGDALRAIAKHAGSRNIRHSVETGCGATTLLLSHLSEEHTVFALDIGGSVASVRRSPLLRKGVVSFIDGPSQRTLPQRHFAEKLQLALIDGPHAYPFPDLEYYFLYPHLDVGALLILDDIQIRSVHNLFEVLRRDRMFRLDEVVRTTAFFTRTDAPTFDPLGDGWRQQRYNERTLLRYDWRSRLASVLPRSVLRRLAGQRHRPSQSRRDVQSRFSRPARRSGLPKSASSKVAPPSLQAHTFGSWHIARTWRAGGLRAADRCLSPMILGPCKSTTAVRKMQDCRLKSRRCSSPAPCTNTGWSGFKR
jgi:hypothetical protein